MTKSLKDAMNLIDEFLRAYVEERNAAHILRCVTDGVFTVGMGKSEIAHNKKEFQKWLELDIKQHTKPYAMDIVELNATPLGDGVIAFVAINIGSEINSKQQMRLTLGLMLENDTYKICSIHASVALESKENLALIFENMDIGFMIGDLENNNLMLYTNQKALCYLDCSIEEFRHTHGSRLSDFLHPDDKTMWEKQIAHLAQTQEPVPFEVRAMCKNAHVIWLSGRASCFVDELGKRIGIYVFRDVSRERKLRDALRISEERFRLAFSQNDNSVFDYDIILKQIFFPDDLSERYGLPQILENAPDAFVESGLISHEDAPILLHAFRLIDDGELCAVCEIPIHLANKSRIWCRISMTNIFEEDGQPVRAVGIMTNITLQKEMEQKYEQESQFHRAMTAQTLAIYETNVTQNRMEGGFHTLDKSYDIADEQGYQASTIRIAEKVIHPDDRKAFLHSSSRDYMLSSFKEGIDRFTLEYRRLSKNGKNGEYSWVSSTTHLVCNPESRELISYTYVIDIDEQKQRELALQYEAERDLLTMLYNRKTTEAMITQALENVPPNTIHAFMLLDLDDFKSVNDRMGHVFGDAVLVEVGRKLRETFRKSDILSRVGGDEFVVFLKDARAVHQVLGKAKEICENFRTAYVEGERSFKICCSVGIALYPQHGSTFLELYEKADAALYHAKRLGKDGFSLYDEMTEKIGTHLSLPNNRIEIVQQSFESHISEYIFKILFNAHDMQIAVESVLELLSVHFRMSRGYVLDCTQGDPTAPNIFEWCNTHVLSQREGMCQFYREMPDHYASYFKFNSIYCANTQDIVSPKERAFLEQHGTLSTFQCAIRTGEQYIGFIGFDACSSCRVPRPDEISAIRTAADILGTFLQNKHTEEAAKRSSQILKTVMDHLDSYTYVIHPDSHQLLFMSHKMKQVLPDTRPGCYCYQIFRGQNAPCLDCPITALRETSAEKYTQDIYNQAFGIWMETTASWVEWADGKCACLLSCVDISKYKPHPPEQTDPSPAI